VLTFQHNHLLAQKSVLGNQLWPAARQIGDYSCNLAIRRWFDPLFHLCFDLLNTTGYQLLTGAPELTPVHCNHPFL
jgi:hypothetical protein